jgi:hypothetical protein
MSFQFQPGKFYRMPVVFGPSLGPRQRGSSHTLISRDAPKATVITVRFRTDGEQLEALLPEGFALAADPVVSVRATYLKEIPWLAGRGYNHLGISFPATFKGKRDAVTGDFLTVLWENLCDPILTGREELGYSKIYCELPEPVVHSGTTHCTASWLGFTFMDLRVSGLKAPTAEEAASLADPRSEGVLHYKYVPRTGKWGTADAAYATLTPVHDPNREVTEVRVGEGSVQFHEATWEDLPTLYNITNTFHAMQVKEWCGASIVKTVGAKDYSDQRILL